MYYFLIGISSVLFSFQFLFNNGYEKECKSSLSSSLNFSFYTAIIGCLCMLIINQFHISFSLFVLAVTLVYALTSLLYNYCSIKAFESINLSVYAMFAMLGGMLLPFLVGIIFYREAVTPAKIIGCILICIALIAQVQKGDKKKGAVKYYFFVFILNGMFGVISKFYQTNAGSDGNSINFLIFSNFWIILLCLLFMGKTQKRIRPVIHRKALLYCIGFAVFSRVGDLLLLVALKHLPASVQYPIVTGGVIVISTIISLLRKQQVTRREKGAAAIAFLSSVLMAF